MHLPQHQRLARCCMVDSKPDTKSQVDLTEKLHAKLQAHQHATAKTLAFDPQRLERQLAIDSGLRTVFLGVLIVAMLLIFVVPEGVMSGWGSLLIIGVWLGVTLINAQVAQSVERITRSIEMGLVADAERMIASGLGRYPLHPSLRLTLYHRLAVLRHRQGRFAETAMITHALLTHRLGKIELLRSHLLLMLLESQLVGGQMMGAYMTMMELHRRRLSLTETMHLLPLQTRYELMCGHDQAVLAQCDRKIAVAELMPAPQAGLVHQWIGIAAQRQGREKLADFCQRRAALLCDPDQLQATSYGGVDVIAQ